MRKTWNTAHIEGRIYQHDLEVKTVKNQASKNFGKPYIGGKIEVAVDEACLSVIPVSFTYVTETTSKGGKNKTYAELLKIIENGKTVMMDGVEVATKVSIDTAQALNDFIVEEDQFVSQQILNGGFVEIVDKLKDEDQRAKFKMDMVITNIKTVDADPEKFIDEPFVAVRGAAFTFRNELLPYELVVKNPLGMKYFEDLEVSNANPLFTSVWGNLNFTTKSIAGTTEAAFGEDAVDVKQRKVKEWVITGCLKVPYDFGDEKELTMDELIKLSQNREVHLADIKKKREEYLASQQTENNAFGGAASFSTPTPTPTAGIGDGAFKF